MLIFAIFETDHPDRKQGKVGPWCCAITSLAVAITGAILAFTFPFLYHNILNYVIWIILIIPTVAFYWVFNLNVIPAIVAAVWHVAVSTLDWCTDSNSYKYLPFQCDQQPRCY